MSGDGLSKPDHMPDEQYAEFKRTAEGINELTHVSDPDEPEEDNGEEGPATYTCGGCGREFTVPPYQDPHECPYNELSDNEICPDCSNLCEDCHQGEKLCCQRERIFSNESLPEDSPEKQIVPARCAVCCCIDRSNSCTALIDLEGHDLDDYAPPDDLIERSKYCDAVDYAEITINSDGISLEILRTGGKSATDYPLIPHGDWEALKSLLMNLHDREVVIGVKS